MIKEYPVVIVDTMTEEESESVMVFDIKKLLALRPYVDSDGTESVYKTIFFFTKNKSFVVIVSYEQALKDWQDARGVNIIRLVSI